MYYSNHRWLLLFMPHVRLEEEARIDVESTITILIADDWVLAEAANWQTILECYDEVLVHNEAQASAH